MCGVCVCGVCVCGVCVCGVCVCGVCVCVCCQLCKNSIGPILSLFTGLVCITHDPQRCHCAEIGGSCSCSKLKGVNNVYMGMTSPPMMNGHLGQMLHLH